MLNFSEHICERLRTNVRGVTYKTWVTIYQTSLKYIHMLRKKHEFK